MARWCPVRRSPLRRGRKSPRSADRQWSTVWSPPQISRRLEADYPPDVAMRISHEAIYQALNMPCLGGQTRKSTSALRNGRALKVSRGQASKQITAGSCHGSLRAVSVPDGNFRQVRVRAVGGQTDHRHWTIRDRCSGGAKQPVHDDAAASAETARLRAGAPVKSGQALPAYSAGAMNSALVTEWRRSPVARCVGC